MESRSTALKEEGAGLKRVCWEYGQPQTSCLIDDDSSAESTSYSDYSTLFDSVIS